MLRNGSPVALARGGALPSCGAATITQQGRDTTQPARQQYRCESCHRYFDDLTSTVLAGHHQLLLVLISKAAALARVLAAQAAAVVQTTAFRCHALQVAVQSAVKRFRRGFIPRQINLPALAGN
jgi:transposase-like protein